MVDGDFARVRLETQDESPASPRVDDEAFTGIQIAMPRVLSAGEEDVPLCGTWVFPYAKYWQLASVSNGLVYLIRKEGTSLSWTGNFRWDAHVEEPPGPPPENQPPPVVDDPEAKIKGWFNFELSRVWPIPNQPGRYRLLVVLDDIQSNAVEFEVRS